MSTKIEIEKELLNSLYYGNIYSSTKLASIFDCSHITILERMKEHNIDRIKNGYKLNVGFTCKNCGKKSTYHGKKATSCFCSWKCYVDYHNKPNIICDYCGKIFRKSPSHIQNNNFCSKKCYGEWRSNNQKGKDNPRWKGGITPKHQKIRNSKKFSIWRLNIYKKNGYTCQLCGEKNRKGKTIKLNAHHIKSFADYPEYRFDMDNGITLCKDCHYWVHSIKGDEMQ